MTTRRLDDGDEVHVAASAQDIAKPNLADFRRHAEAQIAILRSRDASTCPAAVDAPHSDTPLYFDPRD